MVMRGGNIDLIDGKIAQSKQTPSDWNAKLCGALARASASGFEATVRNILFRAKPIAMTIFH